MKAEKTVNVKENSFFLTNQAAQLVKTANTFHSMISITCGEYTLNAKSLLGMLMLKVKLGDELTITADGEDALEAIEKLMELI